MQDISMDIDRIKSACSETLVVSLLKERDMHGYEMCKEIERRTRGFFSLKHSTVYPLLHKLEKQGLVEARWGELDSGKPRKVYHLTQAGTAYYAAAARGWRELFASLAILVPEVAP